MLLPHFGRHCTRRNVIDVSRRLEAWGFDSVWVRDHILFEPHGLEGNDQTFLDPFVTLSAVAGATERIGLGTAVLIPVRWPLKVAQDFASLSFLANRRVDAGFGLGFSAKELAAAGFSYEDRKQVFEQTIGICQEVWSRDEVSWTDDRFGFENVSLKPKPAVPIVTWYGGSTKASVRRAATYCDGWLPGRIPMATLDDRLTLIRQTGEERGRRILVGVLPLVVVDSSRERARSLVDIAALAPASEGSDRWVTASGGFETIEDLEGLVIAGTPDDCVVEALKFRDRGVDEFVFDFRLDFERYEEQAQMVAEEVVPALR